MDWIVLNIPKPVKYWWIYLLLGIVYLITAVLIYICYSGNTRQITDILIPFFLFCSVFEVLFSVANKGILFSWKWYLSGGLVDLFYGVFLLMNKGLTMGSLQIMFAFWLMVRGFSGLGSCYDARQYGSHKWKQYFPLTILAVLLSFGLIWLPGMKIICFELLAAISLAVIGVLRLFISHEMKVIYDVNQTYFRE